MRNRSAAKRADSSPPAPARISRKILRSSFGSLGSSAFCRSASSFSMLPRAALSSSSANDLIAASAAISLAAALVERDDAGQLGMLPRELPELLEVPRRPLRGQQAVEALQAPDEAV